MEDTTNEIEEFIKTVISQVSSGAKAEKANIKGTVKFELAVTKKTGSGGRLGVKLLEVVDVGGDKTRLAEYVSRISFEIYPEEHY
jgi:hypothetical protein